MVRRSSIPGMILTSRLCDTGQTDLKEKNGDVNSLRSLANDDESRIWTRAFDLRALCSFISAMHMK